jgi:DNA-binding MarR family transcriptional regulator
MAATVTSVCLAALIGQQRARLLLALDRPRTIGELAQTLIAVPSAATHHVDALQAAGLVRRRRCGRCVLVSRTRRGSQLVALYAEPDPGPPVVTSAT